MEPEKLIKILQNKENQLLEMSTQLASHTKTIDCLNKRIRQIEDENDILKSRIDFKEAELDKELKEKDHFFCKIQELEGHPVQPEINIFPHSNEDTEIIPVSSSFSSKKHVIIEDLETLEGSKEPETVISNDVDITKELEKMGLGELIKKY